MSTLTYEIVLSLLSISMATSQQSAQKDVRDLLPENLRYTILIKDEPETSSVTGVMEYIYIGASVLRIIDIFVVGIDDSYLIMGVRPSGHEWVRQLTDTWNEPAGSGPFRPLGLLLPAFIARRQRPLVAADLQAAYRWRRRQMQAGG